ncbi:MAG: hypothetical protein U0R80_18480 [Nocardioidaceae bacterium]
MHPRRPALAVCLASVLLLTACGHGEVVDSGGFQVLVGHDDGSDRAGIGFFGDVTVVGTCLGVEDTVVIWPPGTEVANDDPLTVDVPGLGEVGVGDRIQGGAVERDPEEPPDGLEIPEGCTGHGLVSFWAG